MNDTIGNDPLGTPPTENGETNGMALAAMITGIVGFILAFIPLIGFLSWIICPVAVILGFLSIGKSTGKGMAITGIITGILGFLVCIAWVTLFAAIGAAASGAAEENGIDSNTIFDQISAAPPPAYHAHL